MIRKLISLAKLAFSPPPDTTTPEGRSLHRYRQAARTSLAALGARVVQVLTGLAAVPLTLGYLGSEVFGLWMALTSLVVFLDFTDLGLGVGLMNALIACHGRNDTETPARLVSSALMAMIFIFALLVVFALLVAPLLPLEKAVILQSDQARDQLLPALQALIIVFGFGLCTGLVRRIAGAYQIGAYDGVLSAIGRVLAFGGLLVCVWFKLSLATLIVCFLGIPNLVLGVGGVLLVAKWRFLSPQWGLIRRAHLRTMASIGFWAFLARIGASILQSGPIIILANRLGAASVTPFAVTERLLSTAGILFLVVVQPFWSAYGEAAVRGEWDWVMRTFRRVAIAYLIAYVPISLGVIALGRPVIALWTGEQAAVPGFWLLIACTARAATMAWMLVVQMLLNGLNRMKVQAAVGIAFGVVSLAVGFIAARPLGSAGAVAAMVILGPAAAGLLLGMEGVRSIRQGRRVSAAAQAAP